MNKFGVDTMIELQTQVQHLKEIVYGDANAYVEQ